MACNSAFSVRNSVDRKCIWGKNENEEYSLEYSFFCSSLHLNYDDDIINTHLLSNESNKQPIEQDSPH